MNYESGPCLATSCLDDLTVIRGDLSSLFSLETCQCVHICVRYEQEHPR